MILTSCTVAWCCPRWWLWNTWIISVLHFKQMEQHDFIL